MKDLSFPLEDNRSVIQAYQNYFYIFQGCSVHLEIIKAPFPCVYFKRFVLWNDLRLQNAEHLPAEGGCAGSLYSLGEPLHRLLRVERSPLALPDNYCDLHRLRAIQGQKERNGEGEQ